jgi:ribosomal protein S18 acetylase RimI-like enzyme
MDDSISVFEAAKVDDELVEAMGSLVRQLSASASVPTADEVREIVESQCTTLLLACARSKADRIVGMLTLAIFRIPTGVRARIEDVAVDEAARGKGVGEALSREALRIASARGARTVELSSRPSREAANRLYQRLGFAPRDTNVYRYTVERGQAGSS